MYSNYVFKAYRGLSCLHLSRQLFCSLIFFVFIGRFVSVSAQVIITIENLQSFEESGTLNSTKLELKIEKSFLEFALYPNPTKDQVTLEIPASVELFAFEILSKEGVSVFYSTATSGSVYAAEVIPGIYDFWIYTDQGDTFKTLIVLE